jgi:hypothetical protein
VTIVRALPDALKGCSPASVEDSLKLAQQNPPPANAAPKAPGRWCDRQPMMFRNK